MLTLAELTITEILITGIVALAGVISVLWAFVSVLIRREQTRREASEKQEELRMAELKAEIKELRVANKECLNDRLELWKVVAAIQTCDVINCPNTSTRAATRIQDLTDSASRFTEKYDQDGSAIL